MAHQTPIIVKVRVRRGTCISKVSVDHRVITVHSPRGKAIIRWVLRTMVLKARTRGIVRSHRDSKTDHTMANIILVRRWKVPRITARSDYQDLFFTMLSSGACACAARCVFTPGAHLHLDADAKSAAQPAYVIL